MNKKLIWLLVVFGFLFLIFIVFKNTGASQDARANLGHEKQATQSGLKKQPVRSVTELTATGKITRWEYEDTKSTPNKPQGRNLANKDHENLGQSAGLRPTNFPKSQEFALAFLQDGYKSSGNRPQSDILYNLTGLQPLQKLSGGYMFRALPNQGPFTDSMFLYTDENIQNNECLGPSAWGYYVGTYKYQSITGFDEEVFAFKLVEGEALSSEFCVDSFG